MCAIGGFVAEGTRFLTTTTAALMWTRLTGDDVTPDRMRDWCRRGHLQRLGIEVLMPRETGGRHLVSTDSMLTYLEVHYSAALERIRAEIQSRQRQ